MTSARMFASDLDGTLLGPDHTVSARTRTAIAAADRAGVEVVAATGRSRLTALPLLEDTPIRWAVCSNGAMVWDRDVDAVDLHRPIDGALAVDVIGHLRATVPGVTLGWEVMGGYGFEHRYAQKPPSLGRHGIAGDQPEPTREDTVLKLFVDHPDVATASEAMEVLGSVLPDGVTGASSGGAYLELTATGVNKASTLAMLADRLGVAHADVTTFGDSHNDIEMLRWAGTGVAMGNAHPDVAAVSDQRARTNADDGVAVWIETALSNG
ncbi:MAG: HAD family hydrolase [Actinomycetota bacterium]